MTFQKSLKISEIAKENSDFVQHLCASSKSNENEAPKLSMADRVILVNSKELPPSPRLLSPVYIPSPRAGQNLPRFGSKNVHDSLDSAPIGTVLNMSNSDQTKLTRKPGQKAVFTPEANETLHKDETNIDRSNSLNSMSNATERSLTRKEILRTKRSLAEQIDLAQGPDNVASRVICNIGVCPRLGARDSLTGPKEEILNSDRGKRRRNSLLDRDLLNETQTSTFGNYIRSSMQDARSYDPQNDANLTPKLRETILALRAWKPEAEESGLSPGNSIAANFALHAKVLLRGMERRGESFSSVDQTLLQLLRGAVMVHVALLERSFYDVGDSKLTTALKIRIAKELGRICVKALTDCSEKVERDAVQQERVRLWKRRSSTDLCEGLSEAELKARVAILESSNNAMEEELKVWESKTTMFEESLKNSIVDDPKSVILDPQLVQCYEDASETKSELIIKEEKKKLELEKGELEFYTRLVQQLVHKSHQQLVTMEQSVV